MRMSFLPTLAGGVALATALFPDPTLEGSPIDSPCGRFAVSSHQAGELAATLHEAASFVASEPRPFERCPDLVGALRALVVGLTEVGDFERAGAACDLLALGTPLEGEDLIRCARPALRRGRMDEARRLLAAFVAGAGRDAAVRQEAVTRAADVLEDAARFREAAEFLDLGPGPDVPSPLVLRRIHNLLRIGDGDAAREAFDRAAARPESAPDPGFLRDACLLFTRYGEAGPAARAASLLATVPDFGEAEADTVILAAQAVSDPVLAERAARRLVEDAEAPDARLNALRTAAVMLERHGFVRPAARVLEEGLRAGALVGADDLVLLARLLVREGRTQEAHRVLSRVIETRVGNRDETAGGGGEEGSDPWERTSAVWLDAGLAEEAIAFLRRHEAQADPAWVLALGRALHHAHQDDEESSLYERAAKRFGQSQGFDFWRRVGARYRERSDFARARDAVQTALRAATTDAERAHAHLDLAETLLDDPSEARGRGAGGGDKVVSRRAEAEVLAAMEFGDLDPSIESRIERIIERIGRSPALSLAFLEAAVTRDPARPDLWRRLGTARLRAHRARDALEAFRRFVEASRADPSPRGAEGRGVGGRARPEPLTEVLSTLLDAGRTAEAIAIVASFEQSSGPRVSPVALPPEVSRRVGMACASVGDRPCVSRYLGRFLDGPVVPDGDYLECARTLAGFRLWTLADRAIATASKAFSPDRAWEVEAEAGEVALARGRVEEAEARFRKALESVPQKRGMVERAAQAYQDAGRLRLAASWWRRAVQDLDGSARLRALGRLIEVLVRLQDMPAVRDAVRQVFPEPPSGPSAWTLMESLATAGLVEEAVGIARAVSGLAEAGPSDPSPRTDASEPPPSLPRTEGLEPATAWPWLAGLFMRAGRPNEALELVRRVCLRPGGEPGRDDPLCVEMTRALSGRSRPRDALQVLESRCRRMTCGPLVLVEIAALRMRIGDRAGAAAAARRAAGRCDAPEAVFRPLGPLFRRARAWADYVGVLRALRERPEFAGNPDLTLETAEAHLEAGERDEALLLLSAFLGTGRGREAAVYRLLTAFGLRDEASRILLESPEPSLERMSARDLRDIVADLLRAGREDVADRVLDGIRRSDAGRLASERVAQVLVDLGRHGEALTAFERVGPDRISPEGLLDWVRVLWRTGRREQAFEVARAAHAGGEHRLPGGERNHRPAHPLPSKDDVASDCRPLVAFFLDEEDIARAWALYSTCGKAGVQESDRDLEVRLAVAMARSGEERFLAPARDFFIESLLRSDGLNAALAEFVRIEVARRRAVPLIQAIEEWGSSRVLLEARAWAACLAGQREDLDDALEGLSGPPDEPDPRGLLAASRSLLRCGRFQDAYRTALQGLEASGPAGPLGPLSRVAVRAGLAAGIGDAPRRVEDLLGARVEDRARSWHLIAGVRRDGGDWQGHAEARFREAEMGPSSLKARMAAFRAALLAGDEALAARAAALVIESSSNRVEAVLTLADVARRHLRDDWAVPWLAREREAWPGDPALARTELEARLRAGPEDGLAGSALAYVRTVANPRSGWADVVSLAAGNLRLGLLEDGLRHLDLDPGTPGDREAEAWLLAGVAALRAGDEPRGRRLVVRSVFRARDQSEALARLAEAAIEDPSVPGDVVEETLRSVEAATRARPLPLVEAARCLAGHAREDPSGCVRSLASHDRVAVLLAAFRKALLSGRVAMAPTLVEAVRAEDASRGAALAVTATLVATMWPATPDTREAARGLALAAREGLARTGTRSLPTYPSLEAHLSDLADGPGAGLTAYLARLSVAPAEAEARNNLAYYLSVGGLDLRRALREVRLAEALSSRGHPFYLETEAWTEFLRGETGRALELQERARNLWHLDQGGGLAESFLHLGRMVEAAGRAPEAEAAYRRAVVLEPLEAAGVEALRRWRALARREKRGIH